EGDQSRPDAADPVRLPAVGGRTGGLPTVGGTGRPLTVGGGSGGRLAVGGGSGGRLAVGGGAGGQVGEFRRGTGPLGAPLQLGGEGQRGLAERHRSQRGGQRTA